MAFDLADLEARGLVAPDWAAALAPVAGDIRALGERLDAEGAYLPAEENVFRAFRRPMSDVKVLIVGQDPYPDPRKPMGLSFAVNRGVTVPGSLKNIYAELYDDLHIPPAGHGDLSAWSDQGVMLLNRILTVRRGPGTAGSHERWGWQVVTDRAIEALVDRGKPLVAMLWGDKAKELATRFPQSQLLTSSHPSFRSYKVSFQGSRPFSRANALLVAQGGEPVDWRLPE